jgi:hypothetical protein
MEASTMPMRSASGKFTAPLPPGVGNIRAMLRAVRLRGWAKPCLEPPRLNDKGRRWRINSTHTVIYPHRLLWEEENGSLADSAMLFRKCATPGCCEPSHHELTQRDNYEDELHEALMR